MFLKRHKYRHISNFLFTFFEIRIAKAMRKSTLNILVAVLVLFSVLNNTRILYPPNTVADPDLKLRGRGGGDFVLLTLPAFPPSVVSSFFIQSKVGKGGSGPPRPLP